MDINEYISTKLEDQFEEKLAANHNQVIIGLLSNNNVIQSEKRDISHYVFIVEDKSILSSEYIRKHAKMVPTELIGEYTDLRSNDQMKEQVVVFLPIVYHLHSANCKSYRTILQYLLRCLMEVDYMAIQGEFGIFQFDQAIENLFQLEKKFWDANQDQWTETKIETDSWRNETRNNHPGLDWFLSRRFKNHMYEHTKDYGENIAKINDAEFDDGEGGWYDTGVVPDETFERQTHYQIWKESIKFEPLPIEEYQSNLTYYETEILFQLAHRHSKELFYKLCILFLGSYQLCHLIILNESCSKLIMEQFQELEDTFKTEWWKEVFHGKFFQEPPKYSYSYGSNYRYVHQVYNRMSRILYYEERLLAGTITTEHRSMIPISFAASLRNPVGVKQRWRDSEVRAFWYRKDVNYYFPFPANTSINYNRPPNPRGVYQKIVDYPIFLDRFQQVSGGCLDGLDWQGLNVFFTGAAAELCYYNNTIFEFKDLISNAYAGSDMDLGIHIDPEELGITESLAEQGNNDLIKAELLRRAEIILGVVRKNTGLADLELAPRNNRWTISHSSLPREIDIFSFIQDPAALIYNYHMATCRVIAQPTVRQEEADQTPVKILTSACLSAMIGTGIDRRWYSSNYSIHHRIIKQFQRGIGMIMNPHETKVIIQYLMEYRKSHPEDKKKNAILYEHNLKQEDFNQIFHFYNQSNQDKSYWGRASECDTANIFIYKE